MLNTYYPEMGETKPEHEIDAQLMMTGKHWFLKSRPMLKGRGVTYLDTLTAEQLTPQAQHKAGWHTFKVTERAFEAICKKYAVASEILL